MLPPTPVEPTNLIFGFDTSGSMRQLLPRLKNSFNTEILATHKKTFANAVDINGIVPAHELCYVSMITFSGKDNIDVVFKDVPIQDIEPIGENQLVADGMTALRTTIVFVDNMLSTLRYPGRKTMIFYLTDGEDTDSCREHTPHAIRTIFQRYEETKLDSPKTCISATLIGSNQDAVMTGDSMGLPNNCALTFNDDNIDDAMSSVKRMVSRVLSGEDSSPMIIEDDRVRSCPDYMRSANSADFEIIDDNCY
jgi:uncharacterized protein YegL